MGVADLGTDALPDEEDWVRAFILDTRKLKIFAHLHACGASCIKYNKKKGSGVAKVCRHGFYHIVEFWIVRDDENGTGVRIRERRPGKGVARECEVCVDDDFGCRGRIRTEQDHPWEGPSNLAGQCMLRYNLDVQALHRVILDFVEDDAEERQWVGARALGVSDPALRAILTAVFLSFNTKCL